MICRSCKTQTGLNSWSHFRGALKIPALLALGETTPTLIERALARFKYGALAITGKARAAYLHPTCCWMLMH